MKHSLFMPLMVSALCCSCMTRIVTVSPYTGNSGTYSTTISVPKTHTVTTTTRVMAVDDDISLCLDLQAVAAAFAQSSNVREFEKLLNNASFILSNLDLNRDGYVDYLRVLETVEGRAHVFLIQAVLAPDIFQDVATLVAEMSGTYNAYVQVIGDPYLYGPGFIVQPLFISTPVIYAHLNTPAYQSWRSPWAWDHFPGYYKRPKPIYVSHYQAYVNTYMANHRYCRNVEYVTVVHYPDYVRLSAPVQRNDYSVRHPEESYSVRNNGKSVERVQSEVNSPRAGNARDIIDRQKAATETTVRTSSGNVERTTTTRPASAPVQNNATVNARPTSQAATSSQATSASRTPSSSQATSASRTPSSSQTTSATQTSSATTQRTTSSSQSGRSSSAGNAASATGDKTTVSSRVSSSGSSNTRIRTESATGSTTTKRESTASRTASDSNASGRSTSSSRGGTGGDRR